MLSESLLLRLIINSEILAMKLRLDDPDGNLLVSVARDIKEAQKLLEAMSLAGLTGKKPKVFDDVTGYSI